MSSGVPVVVTDALGAKESVVDGTTALVASEWTRFATRTEDWRRTRL